MDSELQAVGRLAVKIEKGLPEIQLRSIAALHTKLSLGLIDPLRLYLFTSLPGSLLSWINDNNQKSEHLLKVLTILSYYTRSQEGLVLLQEYQALEFFEELRKYMLANQRNVQEFTRLLEEMIRALLPLRPNTKPQIPLPQKSQLPVTKPIIESQPRSGRHILKLRISKEILGKKEDEQLYGLLMELRHGKKQLQLACLSGISKIVRYWGQRSYRYKEDLIKELTECSRGSYQWLSISILSCLIEKHILSSRKLERGDQDVVRIGLGLVGKPDVQWISIQIEDSLLSSVYSFQLLDQLFEFYSQQKEINWSFYEWIIVNPYRFSYKYFIMAIQKIIKHPAFTTIRKSLSKSLQLYCNKFPESQKQIICIFSGHPTLNFEDIPEISRLITKSEKQRAFKIIEKYVDQEWQISSQLHRIAQIIQNYEEGIRGISFGDIRRNLRPYIQCLLVIGLGVARQDSLMSFYPRIKQLIQKIAQDSDCSGCLYEQLLNSANNFQQISYLSKKYVKAELTILVLGDQQLFEALFRWAFQSQQTLRDCLELSKKLVGENAQILKKYAPLFYCLSFHRQSQIHSLSSLVLGRLPKNCKFRVLLMGLFGEEAKKREQSCRQLLGEGHPVISLLGGFTKAREVGQKKPLKVVSQTIVNYSKVMFNESLQMEVRLSGAQQLADTLQRAQNHTSLVDLFTKINMNILAILSSQQPPLLLVLPFLRIYSWLQRNLQDLPILKDEILLHLLQSTTQADACFLILEEIYARIFQNPFSSVKQTHYSMMLFPHLKIVSLPVSPQPLLIQSQPEQQHTNSTQTDPIPNQYRPYVEWLLPQLLSKTKINLEPLPSFVQAEIGQALVAAKGNECLPYLAHSLALLKNIGVILSPQLSEHSSGLLNSLLGRELGQGEAVTSLLSLIGFRRTKQLHTLMGFPNENTLWKYRLMLEVSPLSADLVEGCVKRLIGLNSPREAVLILQVIQKNLGQLTPHNASLLLTCLLNLVRQDDSLLRESALIVIFQLYRLTERPEGPSPFTSLTGLLIEQPRSLHQTCIFIQLLRILIHLKLDDVSSLRAIAHKLAPFLYQQSQNPLLAASIISCFNTALTSNHSECLQQLDLVDTVLALWSRTPNDRLGNIQSMHLVISATEFLFLWIQIEPELPKYLLSSTNLLQILFLTIQGELPPENLSSTLLENVSRLLMRLVQEEDLFVYKLSQQLPLQSNIFQILAIHKDVGKEEYLKLYSWMIVIWSKGRDLFDHNYNQAPLGAVLAKKYIESSDPYLIKSLLAFSWHTKLVFLNSSFFSSLLKQGNQALESLLAIELKDAQRRRKEQNPERLRQLQRMMVILRLLGALFYEAQGQQPLPHSEETKANLRKTVAFLEKAVILGEETGTIRETLKTLANMSLCGTFSLICGARLSEGTSGLADDAIAKILKAQNVSAARISFRVIGVIVEFQSVRGLLTRGKVIEQLAGEEQRGEGLQLAVEVVDLFTGLSLHKDTSIKLLGDKRVLECLLRHLKAGRCAPLEQKIVKLLANLACFRHNKPVFMANRDLHKIILGLLQDPRIPYRAALVTLLYNLLYKNASALRLYRRPEVIEVLHATGVQGPVVVSLLQALEGEGVV